MTMDYEPEIMFGFGNFSTLPDFEFGQRIASLELHAIGFTNNDWFDADSRCCAVRLCLSGLALNR